MKHFISDTLCDIRLSGDKLQMSQHDANSPSRLIACHISRFLKWNTTSTVIEESAFAYIEHEKLYISQETF